MSFSRFFSTRYRELEQFPQVCYFISGLFQSVICPTIAESRNTCHCIWLVAVHPQMKVQLSSEGSTHYKQYPSHWRMRVTRKVVIDDSIWMLTLVFENVGNWKCVPVTDYLPSWFDKLDHHVSLISCFIYLSVFAVAFQTDKAASDCKYYQSR